MEKNKKHVAECVAKKKKNIIIILKAGVRRSKERKEKKFKDRFGRGKGVKGGGTKRKSFLSLSLSPLSFVMHQARKKKPPKKKGGTIQKKAQKNYIYIHIS